MYKNAVTSEKTVIYLVLGLVLVVFLIQIIQFGAAEASGAVIDRANCAKTVDRMEGFNKIGIPVPDSSLDCPTVYLKINDEDNGKNKEKIAQSMYFCATQFGRGGKQLFNNNGIHCNVCYVLDIQTKDAITGLAPYLLENLVPGPSRETYHEYMQGLSSEGANEFFRNLEKPVLLKNTVPETKNPKATEMIIPKQKLNEIILEPNKQYATIFMYARGQDSFEKAWRHITAQTPAGKAGLAGGGISFAAFAGGSAVAVYALPFATFGGPVGLAIVGTGLAIGTVTFAGVEAVTHYFSPDTPPEYASFFVFRDWDETTTPGILTNDPTPENSENLGCDFFS